MERERLTMNLPEVLVERIIAMMPFPQIFKARALSKVWLVRLSAIPSEENHSNKVLAEGFQRLVGEFSRNWDSFWPCRLTSKGCLRAYDRAACSSRTIFSLSFLPKELILGSRRSIEGSLVFLSYFSVYRDEEMYVANVLTRSWRRLPPRPGVAPRTDEDERNFLWRKLVIDNSSQSYKVIVLWNEQADGLSADIYDSRLLAWSSKKFLLPLESSELKGQEEYRSGQKHLNRAYLNGILYILRGLNRLVAVNLEGVSEDLTLALPETILLTDLVTDLVACSGGLFMVVTDGALIRDSMTCLVLKIDLGSRNLSQVTRGPPDSLDYKGDGSSPWYLLIEWTPEQILGLGDCIYFGAEVRLDRTSRVLAYNVRKDEWNCLPLSYHNGPSFQPGLNPFVSV